jgi:putative transposase
MPTHCHLLFEPETEDTLGAVMREIKVRSAKQVLSVRARTGPFWQARSFDRVLRNRTEWSKAVEYIHWNPVKDGLVHEPGDWPWYSWGGYVPGGRPPIPIDRIELPANERTPLAW